MVKRGFTLPRLAEAGLTSDTNLKAYFIAYKEDLSDKVLSAFVRLQRWPRPHLLQTLRLLALSDVSAFGTN